MDRVKHLKFSEWVDSPVSELLGFPLRFATVEGHGLDVVNEKANSLGLVHDRASPHYCQAHRGDKPAPRGSVIVVHQKGKRLHISPVIELVTFLQDLMEEFQEKKEKAVEDYDSLADTFEELHLTPHNFS